jgi:hypothetical protein
MLQILIEVLEHKVAYKQETLMKVKTRASEVEKECLNSMEDIKHYHQTLIDMKEKYQKDDEMFAKVAQLASNNM